MTVKNWLKSCPSALSSAYDLALLDLDGVVYIGEAAVPGAPEALSAARASGMRLAFVTNNAGRPPYVVGAHLRDLGIDAPDSEVVTSAQAAARVLSERLPSESRVYVIGGEGLVEALRERGLVPVDRIEDDPVAVVSGYHPSLTWGRLRDGAILVGRGLWWVASNTDAAVPTPHGLGPGNGAAVDVVARFTGVTPVVAGKPEPPLFQESVRRVGGVRPLVVGDRLDTDIEGAHRSGYDSLLVLTGVTGLEELVQAGPQQRPSYIAADLSGLGRPHRGALHGQAGGWSASVDAGGALTVAGAGDVEDWWLAVCDAGWSWLDQTGTSASTTRLGQPGSVSVDA